MRICYIQSTLFNSSPGDKSFFTFELRERSGSVEKCFTQDRGVASLILTSATVFCPSARHINPCLVLVQPRKTHPDITEELLTGM